MTGTTASQGRHHDDRPSQLFKRGLRNQFLNGSAPLNPAACRFVAEAVTRRSIPDREDLDREEVLRDPNHPRRRAIETAGPGQVLVLDGHRAPSSRRSARRAKLPQ